VRHTLTLTPTPTPTLTRVAYSIEEAATLLGLSARTVRRLVWSGELHALRSGRRVLIEPGAITDFLGSLAQATR
jgi:excisionase family DNA binding protein